MKVRVNLLFLIVMALAVSCSNLEKGRRVASDTTGNPVASSSGLVVKDSTCKIYLPTNEGFSSWGENKNFFTSKGYYPIEISDSEKLPDGSLVAELSYSINEAAAFFKTNKCKIEVEVSRLKSYLDKGQPLLVNYYSASANQKSLFKTIRCGKAMEEVFQDIPNCEIE